MVTAPPERAASAISSSVGAIGCVRDDVGLERVRAFVKIQDGCSFGCSFCVIPQVRGGSRSRTAARCWERYAGGWRRATARSC